MPATYIDIYTSSSDIVSMSVLPVSLYDASCELGTFEEQMRGIGG